MKTTRPPQTLHNLTMPPGDLVLDPMCGIGTTLIEALHQDRRALGVEYEPHWVHVTRANLDLARQNGIEHHGRVFHGDARQLATLLPEEYLGQAALVVTSPPYGPSTHGQVTAAPAPACTNTTTSTATPSTAATSPTSATTAS